MKINKQFQLILAVGFFIPLIRQIANAVLLLLYSIALDIENMFLFWLLSFLTTGVSLIITPILLFALFYYIGKKPFLTFEMRPILLALLIGNIASSLIGSIIYLTIAEMTVGNILGLGGILGYIFQSILTYFVVDYLAALAGLSIGYIRQKKLALIAEPESS